HSAAGSPNVTASDRCASGYLVWVLLRRHHGRGVGIRRELVDPDSLGLLDLLGRTHHDDRPGHLVADANADLAADAFVVADVDGRDHLVGRGQVLRHVLDAVDGAERDAGLAPGAAVHDDRELLGAL